MKIKSQACVEVYNRLAGEGKTPNPKYSYNWLTIAWFNRDDYKSEKEFKQAINNFVSIVKNAIDNRMKPKYHLGKVKVTYSYRNK